MSDEKTSWVILCPLCDKEMSLAIEGVCINCAKKIAETYNVIYSQDEERIIEAG